MKNLISILIVLLTLSQANAQGIDFFHGTFDEAKAEAEAQGKLIFMDAYAVWCGPCKMMTNSVFPQQEVGDFFNANFINLKVDMEKGECVDLRRKYGVSAYPTLLIIDAKGEVVQSIRGARNAEGLIAWAKKVALPNPGLSKELQEKYDNGDRDAALMRDLIKVKAAYKEDYNGLFEEYVNGLSEEEIVDPKNVNFIFEQTTSPESPGLEVIADYKEYFADVKGADVMDSKLTGIARNAANLATKQKDIAGVNDAIDFLNKYKPENYKETSSELMVGYYGSTEDWSSYDKAVTKHLAKYKKGDDAAYRDVAWNYYMKIDNEASLRKAEKWMQTNIKTNNTYENNLIQSYLLYKLEDYSAAEDAVNYALILAGGDKKTKNAQILKDGILKKMGKTENPE